ncbi:MAG: hypothetical protein JNL35_03295 [Sphingopyxis sp.]|nr:hypothetical protein [Sphingopyxis sp.]
MAKTLQDKGVMPDIDLATDPKRLLAQALDLGPPTYVLKACGARFK